MRKHIFLKFAVPAAILSLNACGSATFDSGSTGKQNGNATGTPGYTGQKVDQLTWFWQCESAPETAPQTSGGDVVIYGSGDHRFQSSSFDKTPLVFSGKVCPPVTYPRDIIFVVDVSGSMSGAGGNDPKVGSGPSTTCGRLQAVQAIVDDITSRGGDSRFAIVTFSTGIAAKSSTMFGDRVNLFADISQGSNIANTLCAANGSTNYGAGLSAAESILNGSRTGAIKEIYFVSDGEPTDSGGPGIAQNLKLSGININGKATPVTIATTMLGNGKDTVLRTQIASLDSSGKPLHAGSVQASDLAKTLSILAANEIIEGKMLYRPLATDAWQEISLLQSMKGYNFTAPSITIDRSVAPNGLEVSFEYRDQHNNIYSSQGKISWSDLPTKTK
jgi:hypothetical protein